MAKSDGTNSYYYLYNGHGDVVQITDVNGNIVNSYDYDSWGNILSKNETIENPFTYYAQQNDDESGLYYLRARYYDPKIGRFTQEDTALDGDNWYAYANCNPIMFVDPWGLYHLEKGVNATVYAVIERGDTLSQIAYSEVRDANAYTKMIYSGNPNSIQVGQKINITEIYNKNYPNPYVEFPNTTIAPATNIYNTDNDSVEMLDKEVVVGITAILTPGIKYGISAFGASSLLRYPGNDPTKSPGKGFEWRGKGDPSSGKGNWYNPKTGESFHPDLNHADPIGPHWDYIPYKNGPEYRLMPNGNLFLK